MSAGKVVIVSDGEFEQTVLKSEIPVKPLSPVGKGVLL